MTNLILSGWMIAAALVIQAPNPGAPAAAESQQQRTTEATAAEPEEGTREEVVERIERAEEVLEEVMGIPEEGIPQDLLADAHCVGIVPGVVRGAFIIGAQYGKGVLTCRDDSQLGWTAPSTVRIEGGSVGFQIGGSETDLFLLVMNEEGAESLIESEFTFGADASVAAGPVGREVEAETDAALQAGILSYSRSRGAFAGVSIEGATLRADEADNAVLYGEGVTHEEILSGRVMAPPEARRLIERLNMYSASEGTGISTGREGPSEQEPALAPREDDDLDLDDEDDEDDDLDLDDNA